VRQRVEVGRGDAILLFAFFIFIFAGCDHKKNKYWEQAVLSDGVVAVVKSNIASLRRFYLEIVLSFN